MRQWTVKIKQAALKQGDTLHGDDLNKRQEDTREIKPINTKLLSQAGSDPTF